MAFKFLKTGAASKAIEQQDKIAKEERKAEIGKTWRFFLKVGESAKITFVDGALDAEGFLTPPRYYEHMVKVAGDMRHYVCPEKTNPGTGETCPICAMPKEWASLVAVFTIIDHREYTNKEGKTYKDRQRLLVVKGDSFELLSKIAVKRGGLAGCTFEVSRIGDKSPAIGSSFDFEEKGEIEALKKKYMVEVTDPKTNQKSTVCLFEPLNYEQEITYKTGDELRAMGFGGSGVSGYQAPTVSTPPTGDAASQYAEQL